MHTGPLANLGRGASLALIGFVYLTATGAGLGHFPASGAADAEAAIAAGVFGVPAYQVDDKLFWGADSLPMLRRYLEGDAWFDGPGWDAVTNVTSGLTRQR